MGIPNNAQEIYRRNSVYLTYRAKAVILAEVNLCSARVEGFNPAQNEGMMVERLDLLEEYQEAATIRLAKYQQELAWCYNRDVKIREFSVRDLVLWKAIGNMRDTNTGKLALTWEGPYRVTAIAGVGAYYLEDLDERPLPQPWNVYNLEEVLSLIGCTRECRLSVILYICFVN